MDIEKQIKAAEEMNKELLKNFEFIKSEDEKSLKNMISFYHANMTPNKKFDIDKIKHDHTKQAKDIIEYINDLFEISQGYYKVIQNIKHSLSKK